MNNEMNKNKAIIKQAKKLILHWHQNDLHPVDYQRLEIALQKAIPFMA